MLCRNCHAQCSGCTGPTNQDCVSCNQDSIMLDEMRTCVPQCGSGQYLARSTGSDHECSSCNDQCVNCTGPSNTNCLQCRRANSTINGITTCMENCPAGMFESTTRLCQACHSQCSGGCTGPSNRECSSCVESTVSVGDGVVECAPFCSFGMTYDTTTDVCEISL